MIPYVSAVHPSSPYLFLSLFDFMKAFRFFCNLSQSTELPSSTLSVFAFRLREISESFSLSVPLSNKKLSSVNLDESRHLKCEGKIPTINGFILPDSPHIFSISDGQKRAD